MCYLLNRVMIRDLGTLRCSKVALSGQVPLMCVAVSTAAHPIGTQMLDLSIDEKELIRLSWSKVMASPKIGADLFYGRLFDVNPDLRPLFKGDMVSQGQKLVETINTVVDNLDADLSETVLKLGTRHQAYKVSPNDYDKVGNALLWMLEAMVGADFGQSTQTAWGKAYGQLTQQMLNGYT